MNRKRNGSSPGNVQVKDRKGPQRGRTSSAGAKLTAKMIIEELLQRTEVDGKRKPVITDEDARQILGNDEWNERYETVEERSRKGERSILILMTIVVAALALVVLIGSIVVILDPALEDSKIQQILDYGVKFLNPFFALIYLVVGYVFGKRDKEK